MLDHYLIWISRSKFAALKCRAALDVQLGPIVAPCGEGQGRGDGSLGADNLDDLVFGGSETALDVRRYARPKFQHGAGTHINSILAIRKHRANGSWFSADQPASGVDAVAANVQQCASAELREGTVVAGGIEGKGKGGVDETQFARLARRYHRFERLHSRVETVHDRLHE